MNRILTLLLLFLSLTPVFSQSENPGVKVQGKATEQGSIKLRWAVNSPSAWHFANEYGYTIERLTIAENQKVLKEPVRKVLNNVPFKPAPQKYWEGPMDEDDYVAVAAQAIFGEDFELTNQYSSDVMKVVSKAKELESRFSYALFSADQSVKAAELSGLYYEDVTIAPNTKYLYRIYTNIPEHVMVVDTGFVYVGLDDYKPLPKPADVRATFEDHVALLTWNGALSEKIYNSFWVERSDDDGKTFKKITRQPVINTYTGDKPKTRNIYKLDSLPVNNKKYYYRVMGINAFGETGPPSDTVSGVGRPVFAYSAAITSHEVTEEGYARLAWTFPEDGKYLVKSYDLLRFNQTTKKHEVVKPGIDKLASTVTDESPHGSNYYVIRANDIYSRQNNSFPYLVQMEDSIPPSPPVELAGRIDTLGHVYLNWKANTESDLKGYKLFKSNFMSEEFIEIESPIFEANAYVDTIKLNNLTEKIYYKVIAMDKRFNSSDFSEVLMLEKPDLIPPVPPVFTSIKGDSLGISISWEKSSSEDVAMHMLYRKADGEPEWTLVKVIDTADTLKSYHDTSLKHRVNYSYTMLAVDDARLESPPAVPLSMRWISPDPYPKIEQLFYTVDKEAKTIKISWVYDEKNVDRYLIYKSVNGQPLQLFKSVDNDQHELTDNFKVSDTSIEYRIAASFKNGDRSRASRAVIVKIQ